MKKLWVCVGLLCAAWIVPRPASAQVDDYVAWVALMTTPVGAFGPSVDDPLASGEESGWGLRARYGHWQFAPNDDNTTNLGVAATFPAGQGSLSLEVGLTTQKDCSSCDAYMVGADLQVPLLNSENGLAVSLNPEVGYMTPANESGFTAFALAANLPIAYPITAGGTLRIVPFLSPGFGLGRVSGGGESETGARLMFGGGAALVHTPTGIRVTPTISRVFLEGEVSVLGIALGFGR